MQEKIKPYWGTEIKNNNNDSFDVNVPCYFILIINSLNDPVIGKQQQGVPND